MTPAPSQIALIGDFVAIQWPDGREDVFSMEELRAASPSAENKGEADLFGRVHGADPRTEYPGVKVDSWHWIGSYALRFVFSDGHQSGLFSFDLLRELGAQKSE
jgi:DUF971 family protein